MSHSTPIRSEDPNAVALLRAEIAKAEKRHAVMRATNAIVRNRKLTDDEKVKRISAECQFPEDVARRLLRPDELGRVGFPAYELTNNSANIRRMTDRVEALERESGRESVTVEFPGGRMEDNAEESRVRVFHDEKPGPEVIQKLKANGFHWTPSARCWQRLRNENARWAASRVTGAPWPVEAPAAPVSTENRASEAPRTGVSMGV